MRVWPHYGKHYGFIQHWEMSPAEVIEVAQALSRLRQQSEHRFASDQRVSQRTKVVEVGDYL